MDMFSALYRAYTRVICTIGYPHVDREQTFAGTGEVYGTEKLLHGSGKLT